jgi:hypothetical protein
MSFAEHLGADAEATAAAAAAMALTATSDPNMVHVGQIAASAGNHYAWKVPVTVQVCSESMQLTLLML